MRLVTICLIQLLSFFIAKAQQPEPMAPRTILKNSPQHFAINSLKLGVERLNSEQTKSLAIFIIARTAGLGQEFDGYDGLGGELQYRKYLRPMSENFTKRNKRFYQGIYAGGFAQCGSYRGKFSQTSLRNPAWDYDYRADVGNWGAGFVLGFQRSFFEVIFVEAYMGGGIQWADKILSGPNVPAYVYSWNPGIGDPDYQGVFPKFGVLIGVPL